MDNPKRIASGVVKGLGKVAGQTIFESSQQLGKVVEDVAEGVIGGGSSSQQPAQQIQPSASDSGSFKRAEEIKVEEEKKELRKNISGQDLDKEIQEVREKRGEQEERDENEEELLKKMAEDRKNEAAAAAADAGVLSADPLAVTGRKPQKGSAFTGPRGSGEKARKKN